MNMAFLNGQPASVQALIPLAFAGYAHFTAAQVRAGRIRGLDLHLERLRQASEQLFGQSMPDEQVRAALRGALAAAPPDVSLLATMYASPGEFEAGSPRQRVELLVRLGPPSSGPAGPLRLAIAEHERFLPGLKHVGEPAKTWFLRQARRQGYDDAAFVDRAGRLSEATIWNLAFWDGDSVVWPDAPMLPGTTMQILRRQLDRLGIGQRVQALSPGDAAEMAGAVVMNSWTPGVAVHRLGDAALPDAPRFLALLHQAFEAEPPVEP